MEDLHPLLFELGMEELPPKALPALRDALRDECLQRLRAAGIAPASVTAFATPRRLALLFDGIPTRQPDQIQERRGPAVSAAFDADGTPTRAAEGFARSCGVEVEALERENTDKGEYLVYREARPGASLENLLPGILAAGLAALPTPKRMRWGSSDVEFVRPVHWLVLLHGERLVEIELLGLRSGRSTRGHRFHSSHELELAHAGDYARVLEHDGMVLASFDDRRAAIAAQIQAEAEAAGGQALIDPTLLDEVTALVEWPVALTGGFDERFLDVPQEALISTMQDNQKYFPLVDAAGKMLPQFVVISNIRSRYPEAVRGGNERVLRPRFADAEFFWEQDRRETLESRQPWLETVVFERRLGTLADKSRRVARLMEGLAGPMGLDPALARRAALLSKCDLGTRMVFEFPELQGTMGRYYAQHDREPEALAQALEQHYWPRQAGGDLPEGPLAQALALADRLDTLVGIFAIGKEPTGARDPFALRRAALGLLRILIEREQPLALTPLLQAAASGVSDRVAEAPEAVARVRAYVLERLRGYLLEQGMAAEVFEAVAALEPDVPLDFVRRARAVQQFRSRPESEALAAANKRTHNLLRKAGDEGSGDIDESLLQTPAEQLLLEALRAVEPRVAAAVDQGDYVAAMSELAGLRAPVDAFFTDVLVMVDDPPLRANRLALLRQLAARFDSVADISRLATG
ncbi:Glycyl-tRNA synthetase beta chain [Thioalkalivibrio nitratireducens DSM 14787]|uniref:Glycine--tRNA ligase beta subunit n=1 Tax=Thioalkalivibrio nitratireducens (strain DSM 14787 / UNIQEM 213 / ALEN2) TaxID=1255043 RepID=L0E1V2_THIND|nr:glycine--tRNA ligase subunit beta [Thioalkalivibrio nitratireducens]AGA35273.1 Glycyl-tRNA synthetase beta chain [Thioalkalivibrio nitratireducens DSM 14787]